MHGPFLFHFITSVMITQALAAKNILISLQGQDE